MRDHTLVAASLIALLAACGDDAATPDAGGNPCLDPPAPFAGGDPDGHADPLGAGPGQARAGRIQAAQLPPVPSGLITWAGGDFVLANDKIALVIEDVGESDLYDPWGGRPVGLARVAGGALVEPADFGEMFVVTGPSTIFTTSVTVMNDGSNGEPAVIRTRGRLAPLPFLNGLLSALYFDALEDIDAVLDYSLAPGAEVVDIHFRYASSRPGRADTGGILHGFMFTPRMPPMVPGPGFGDAITGAEWLQMIDDQATSWAYQDPAGAMGSGVAQSGFVGAINDTFVIPRCSVSERHHARMLIGGPGLDGLEQARARFEGRTLRAITGTVTDGTAPLVGHRVHAVGPGNSYLTRATTDGNGAFTLHVPAGADVTLTAYRRGWATATDQVAAGDTTSTITVPRSGAITVTPTENGSPVPARIQVMPRGSSTIPSVPGGFGEELTVNGRLHVEYVTGQPVTLPVPPGDWEVVVTRGFEYELIEIPVTVTAGATQSVSAALDRSVDTTGIQCGDFHIHTIRSNDSGDAIDEKLRAAVADGLELPVRTEHEWIDSFQDLIEELDLTAWAYGISSIEMTSFQVWGHMNVFPIEAQPSQPNNGAPRWQVWPTAADPDVVVANRSPKAVFDEVRRRPEAPTIIINHPRGGGTEYFNYVGLDRITGLPIRTADWDEEFRLIEIFNSAHWLGERDRLVTDWFNLLNTGRAVFAVGSSDSHTVRSSPLGYPRTCIELGTDDPSAIDASDVRDQLNAGHASISGGIYLDVNVGAAGPGDTATGTGATAQVSVRVQAAGWVDVDAIDVVVDGVTVDTIAIQPGDADGANPVIRWRDDIAVSVAAGGSWVVIAAYGDAPLEPLHPGRIPFAVSQPIWLRR